MRAKGTAVIDNAIAGIYSYTPNLDATGIDSFTFKANDGLADSDIATVSVSITAVNDAPIANNGNLNTVEGVAVNGALSASDVDGNALNFSIVANGSKGTAVITDAVVGAYTYTPNLGAIGADSFSFKANDGLVDSSTATVNIQLVEIENANDVSAVIDNGGAGGSLNFLFVILMSLLLGLRIRA